MCHKIHNLIPRGAVLPLPAWKADLMANTKRNTMPSLNVMLITILDAVTSFNPCLPIYRHRPYVHFIGENECSLIAKFLLQCRRERSKIVKYNDFDIRT